MLARKALLAFATNLVGAFAGAAALFAATHYMPPAAVGMFAFTLSLVMLTSTVANMGFGKAHVKRVSESGPKQQLLGTYAAISASLTIVVVSGSLVAAVLWARAFGFHDATTLTIVGAGMVLLVAKQWREYWALTFQGFRWTAKAQVLVLAEHLVRAPAFILVALVFGAANGRWVPLSPMVAEAASWVAANVQVTEEGGAVALMAAQVLSLAVGIPLAIVLARRAGLRLGRPCKKVARRYASFAWPLTLLTLITAAANQLDSVMVGYFWSATDVAHYYGGQRLAHLVGAIPSAVVILFFPMISELSAAGQHGAVRDLALTAQRYLGLIMIPLTMLLVVYAQEGARIALGPAYGASAPILAVLGAQVLVLGFMALSNNLLAGSDLPRTLAKVGAICAASNIVLNFLLIPSSLLGVPLAGMRGFGAATATLAAQLIGLGVSLVASRRAIGAWIVPRDWWKQGGAALGVGIMMWASKPFLLGDEVRIWELLLSGLLAAIVYAGALAALRGLTKRDLLFFKDLANPRKMGAYIRDELGQDES